MVCLCSVVSEGTEREYVMECTSDSHQFRVAATNSVGKGPYSMPTTYTTQKASEWYNLPTHVYT